MTKRNRSHDKRLAAAKCMPPLRRKEPGGDYYAPEKDEVLNWVSAHPDLTMYLVDLLARIGYITYDEAAGTWKGAAYGD